MKKSKTKRIKKLKRIRILPHLVGLVIFVVFLTIMTAVLADAMLVYMFDSHLEGSYQQADNFAKMIEEQNKNSETISNVVVMEEWAVEDYGILDCKSKKFIVKPQSDISLERFVDYKFDDYTVHVDKEKNEKLAFLIGNNEKHKARELLKLLIETDEVLNPFEVSMSEPLFDLHVWIERPLVIDNYSLFYSADAILRVKDFMYAIIFIFVLLGMVTVPLLLYIITLCISILSQRRSARLLYYDAITGGKNWLYFLERAEHILKRNRRGKRHYAMVSLRMERYQSYCACYGSAEGEQLIERVNWILSRWVKRKEVYARYSEVEFGLLLMMEDSAQITERMEKIREQLINMMKPRKIDFNIGICEVTSGAHVEELYSNSSLARKNIAQNATENVLWFNEKLKEEQIWERFVEENMENALQKGELHVYLQPKYNAKNKRLGGAEALIRWISPTEGFIGPGKFIPIFEKNGFITRIDDFMLSSVAKLQAQWVKEGRNVVPISVNISRAHFTQEDLAEHICKIVEEAGAPRELIELELTESAFFEDKDILINTVEKLKAMGFSVSMDDFGAGYSSLNSLKDLQLDVLKIDADFFRGREENEDRGSLIVSETIRLAQNLGMTTVAEGIESADQVEFLAESGCDLIQGFYFAKPMPIDEYVQKMEEDRANQ